MADRSDSSAGGGRLERRRHRRYVVPMHVTAVRRPPGFPAQRGDVVTLHVKDISKGGLCCILNDRVEPDEELMLFMPPQGGRGGRDVRARVVRTEMVENRYRLALAFHDPGSEAGGYIH